MKKPVVVLAALLVVAVAFTGCLSSDPSPKGFDPDSISAPLIMNAPAANVTMPGPMTAISPPHGISLSWLITEDIYAGYGGVLTLTAGNINPSGQLYIYGFGIEWDTGLATYRNCSVYIAHGEQAELGILSFAAPGAGEHSYRLVVRLAASNAAVTGWRDYGEVPQSSRQDATVLPLGERYDYVVEGNIGGYYDRINSRVSYDDAGEVADAVREARPGEYSILQVAEAYEWVRANIEYDLDGTVDYWQSTSETLELGTGDCEDHAILMASIIGALGGYARVNVIEAHAFPTVFVGSTAQDMERVERALASFYGLGPGELDTTYLRDDIGYWLVIDTTGFPYAGGLPAQSHPTAADGWTVASTYLYPVDATGESGGSFFGF